jgi:putative endonuclease
MEHSERPPSGPRGIVGAAAEDAAAAHLESLGWRVLARHLRVGGDEIDTVASEPGTDPVLVIVEVRSRSGPRFGSPLESVDARKVARLYRAARSLRRGGHPAIRAGDLAARAWRIDLLALTRTAGSEWSVAGHLHGLAAP